ncbi:MAG: NUDIX hydrolase [bacterium]
MSKIVDFKYCFRCGNKLKNIPPVTCDNCHNRFWLNSKPCGAALVYNTTGLLLVKRNIDPFFDYWDIPGGHCDLGEHPGITAIRECFEETGIKIVLTGILGCWISSGKDESGNLILPTLCIYYFAIPSLKNVNLKASTESSEVCFFKYDKLPKKIAFPEHQIPVLQAWKRSIESGDAKTPLLDVTNITSSRFII